MPRETRVRTVIKGVSDWVLQLDSVSGTATCSLKGREAVWNDTPLTSAELRAIAAAMEAAAELMGDVGDESDPDDFELTLAAEQDDRTPDV